jgi:short subunit dehydrogenase-like uncharacterized protein
MADTRWMLYGATGYTGALVAEEAVKHGHTPLLAGRNEEKLRALARRLGLRYVVFDLDDVTAIAKHTANVELVYHAAGPFVHTSDPMIRACLATHTHYVDITGEVSVLENTFTYDDTARKNGIALISGVGFDVIPSDCLCAYVASQVPTAVSLEMAFMALSRVTAGTAKSMLEMMPKGGLVRKNGVLTAHRLGSGGKRVILNGKSTPVLPIPWGDLATAYRSTGIPNITTYMAFPSAMSGAMGVLAPIGQTLFKSGALRRVTGAILDRTLHGPSQVMREFGASYLWACATDAIGYQAEAWLEVPDGYQFTVLASIAVIERTLQLQPVGALTPALAFGADFVLEIDGSTRTDHR